MGAETRAFARRLVRNYLLYALTFAALLGGLAIGEQMGLSQGAIGLIFLCATVGLYAGIGVISRTSDLGEYYVAGRRVPPVRKPSRKQLKHDNSK